MYGFSALSYFIGAVLLAVGIIGSIIFAIYEMRMPYPILDINLLTKNRIFAM